MSVEAPAEAADLPPAYVGLIEQAQESASNFALSKTAGTLHVDVGAIDPIADRTAGTDMALADLRDALSPSE